MCSVQNAMSAMGE
jgi:hypothetical protein